MDAWLTFQWIDLGMVVFSGVVTYAAILGYTRLTGLRSFSKMSAADFAMTVAVGSLFASTMSQPQPSLAVGLIALATLFCGQWLVAYLRRISKTINRLVDNQPLLLLANGKMIHENLQRANVTEADVYAKLREANALNFDEVLAIVFETTGDISVLHSSNPNAKLELAFLEGVTGKEKIPREILTDNSNSSPS